MIKLNENPDLITKKQLNHLKRVSNAIQNIYVDADQFLLLVRAPSIRDDAKEEEYTFFHESSSIGVARQMAIEFLKWCDACEEHFKKTQEIVHTPSYADTTQRKGHIQELKEEKGAK